MISNINHSIICYQQGLHKTAKVKRHERSACVFSHILLDTVNLS